MHLASFMNLLADFVSFILFFFFFYTIWHTSYVLVSSCVQVMMGDLQVPHKKTNLPPESSLAHVFGSHPFARSLSSEFPPGLVAVFDPIMTFPAVN